MKKLLIHALAVATLSVPVSGCIEDGNTVESGKHVRFSTTISSTRAYGNMWESGDRIGVYMLPAGTTDWTGSALLAANAQYGHDLSAGATAANVTFSGIGGDVIEWPGDNGKADFVAYYPYRPTGIVNFVYPVNIANQTSQKALDLLYSDNVAGKNSLSGNPALVFEHKLAKLVFNVTDTGGASLEGMVSTVEGLNTTAGFDLVAGAIAPGSEGNPERFEGLLSSTSDADADGEGIKERAVVEVIVIPGENLAYTLTFVLGNGEKAVFTQTAADYGPGKRYTYTVDLKPRSPEIGFGEAGGSLSTISDWIDAGSDHGELPKTVVKPGPAWSSGLVSSASSDYSITNTGGNDRAQYGANGYRILGPDGGVNGGEATLVMDSYSEGIASVAVTVKRGMGGGEGVISSVRTGTVDFVYNDGARAVPVLSDGDFVFESPDGTLAYGTVTIVVGGSNGTIYLNSFKVN